MAAADGDEVFIVLEGPDMTYYGSAEIHGVYRTREEADARLASFTQSAYSNIGVETWKIGEASDDGSAQS
jgi:uncharacterized protein YfcZ (UPF0381/DUF406 family)